MSTTFTDIPEDEEPSGLRARLEEAAKQNRELQKSLAELKTKDVISTNGFDLVKPTDLAGVPLDQIEAKAAEFQESRSQLQQELLRNAFAKQGLKDEEIEALIAQTVTQRTDDTEAAASVARVRSITGGEPAPLVNPENLHGFDALRAAFSK